MTMRRAAWAIMLLATGCAQVREISGGERDVAGPRLVESFPSNGATRFNGDRFLLRFDERIQVERTREGLLVSPPMDPPPTLQMRGARELEVRLHAPLLPSTTYSFAVGEVVKDLTEGNRASGLDFAMSTGDHLDSLRITGTLTDAFSRAPLDQALVMLFEAVDSTGFATGRPSFITRTDHSGRYQLQRLPARPFRLVALRDLNSNYRYDLPGEEIAFHDAPVVPSASVDTLAAPTHLRLFQERSMVQQIREATVLPDRAWRLVLARPAERIAVRDLERTGGSLTWRVEWGDGRDTLLLWPSDTTALQQGRYEVSTGEGAVDTLRYRPLQPMPFALTATGASLPLADGLLVRIEASRPIRAFSTALMALRTDSTSLPFEMQEDSTQARVLWLRAALPPGKGATFTLLPKALRDIYGGTNDTLRIAVGVAEESALGKLRVTLQAEGLSGAPLVLELIDAQGRTARRAADTASGASVAWSRVQPGNYTMRLIEDINGNGRWDTGDWRSGRQPERVWLHTAPINVRAAWDMGVEWRLDQD